MEVKHTELTNLKKGIPKHIIGEKIINNCIDFLIKKDFIKIKISTNEKHISLNIEKKKEIYEFIKDK